MSASHSSGNGLHQCGGRMHLCNNTTSPCSLRVQPTSQCYRQHCIDTYHPHYQDITLNQHHHQHFLLPALYEFNLSSSLLIRIILTIKVIKLREVCGKSKWKFKMAFAMKGGGVETSLECHIPILINDFFKNHLESFPDCENVFCT